MSEDLTKKLPTSDKDEILTAIKHLAARLGRLGQTVEERLYDTRPMWHRLEADISQLRAGVERLEKGQEELRSSVRDVSRDQIVINDVVRKIQLDFHAIDDRLHRLEVNRN